MYYIKLSFIFLMWYIFLKNSFCKVKSVLFKEKYLSDIILLTEKAILTLNGNPMSINDFLEENKGLSVNHLKKELYKENYLIDEELKDINKKFVRCFLATDTYSLKGNLSAFKSRLEIIYKTILRKKEDIFKSKLLLNSLISIGITIIII